MGEVWRGTDLALSRAVAVKLLHPEHASQPDGLARFRAEAQQAGSLSHPNIAQVYDYCEPAPPDPAYLVLELVDGPSLARHLDGGPLSPARTLDVIEQAASGLAAAHRAGLLHRDIKPGNLLVSQDGLIKITDFGIARAAGSVVHTRTGALTGTPAYLAPERFAGAPATPATDLYALGVVAHQCLTGRLPFAGDPLVVALAHVERDMPPLPDSVPADLAALVADLTRKDPRARPASAIAVLARAGLIRAAVSGPAANLASTGTISAGTSVAGTSAAEGSEAAHTAALDSPAGYSPTGPNTGGDTAAWAAPAWDTAEGNPASSADPAGTRTAGTSHTGTSTAGTSATGIGATKTSFAGTSAAAGSGAGTSAAGGQSAAGGGVPWPDAPGRHAPRRRAPGRSFLVLAGLATAGLAGVVIWLLTSGSGSGPATTHPAGSQPPSKPAHGTRRAHTRSPRPSTATPDGGAIGARVTPEPATDGTTGPDPPSPHQPSLRPRPAPHPRRPRPPLHPPPAHRPRPLVQPAAATAPRHPPGSRGDNRAGLSPAHP